MRILTITVATLIIAVGPAVASDGGNEETTDSQKTPSSGDQTSESTLTWLELAKMTGDWGGTRTELENKGIDFEAYLVQTYGGVVRGGANTAGRYGGLLDMKLTLDTGKAGLWPGGTLYVRSQTQFGEFGDADSGQLVPYNTNGLYPYPGKSRMALTGFNYTQFVTPWLGFVGGKIDLSDYLSNHFQGGRGSDQFLNTTMNFDPVLFVACPLSTMGFASIVVLPDLWKREGVYIELLYAALNATEQSTLMPFKDAFNEGVTHAWLAEVPTNFFNLPGNQQVIFLYTSRDHTLLTQDRRWVLGRVLGSGVAPKKQGSSSAFHYSFTQYLWIKPGSKRESTGVAANTPQLQGIGIFGNLGLADPKTNPAEAFYAIGVSGRGLVPSRDNDTCGAAFFYTHLSSDLGPVLARRTRDPYGVEVYYNVEITPWFHLTGDLQILESAFKGEQSTAIVAALRAKIDF